MTPNEKDYMDRYIYQVIRRLSKAQRDEVRMELEELISDMYTDKGSMEEALTELGDPAEFAKQYQDDQRYLIGPEYFDTYLWFVKVVIVCAAIPILLISLINAIGEMPAITAQNSASVIIRAIVDGLITGITDAILSCVSAFGAVTLTFAIMERKKVQFELKKEEKWSLESLSGEGKTPTSRSRWTPKFLEPVPDKKAIISRGDSVVGIIFIVIFSVLLIFAPHFFAAFFTEGETVMTVPIFNLEQWGIVLPVFILSLLIGLADEILRLIVGVYCRLVMISNIVCGVLQIVLSIIVLKVLPIWNPNFVLEIEQALGDHADSGARFLTYWNADMVSNGFLAFIVAIISPSIIASVNTFFVFYLFCILAGWILLMFFGVGIIVLRIAIKELAAFTFCLFNNFRGQFTR